jgi:hypothetical protein
MLDFPYTYQFTIYLTKGSSFLRYSSIHFMVQIKGSYSIEAK